MDMPFLFQAQFRKRLISVLSCIILWSQWLCPNRKHHQSEPVLSLQSSRNCTSSLWSNLWLERAGIERFTVALGLKTPRETVNALNVSISIPLEGALRALMFPLPAPPSDVTYRTVAADLLHALLAGSREPCVLKVQSLFVLDENSYPLQQDFSLLDFYLDDLKHASHALPWDQRKKMQALQGRALKWFVFGNEMTGLLLRVLK